MIAAARLYPRVVFENVQASKPESRDSLSGHFSGGFHVEPLPETADGRVSSRDWIPSKAIAICWKPSRLLRHVYPDLRVQRSWVRKKILKQRDLKTHGQRLGIEDQVKFLGYQKSVADVMSDCTIGVIASTGSEAVSRVALEWMAAGRPVVATRVGLSAGNRQRSADRASRRTAQCAGPGAGDR